MKNEEEAEVEVKVEVKPACRQTGLRGSGFVFG
jgi:hypothetical protein